MNDLDHIKQETKFIFDTDWFSEESGPLNDEEYFYRSDKLQKDYPWEKIYPVWREYIYKHGTSFKSLVNFANLCFSYGIQDHVIPDPYEFCSFFMYRWDISKLWDEGGEDIENLVISILEKCGYVNFWTEENIYIFEDEKLKYHILKRREADE